MDRDVPRIVEETNPEIDVATMTMMVYSLPRDASILKQVDAVVVTPGVGDEWRVHEAVRLRGDEQLLLVAGQNLGERTAYQFTPEILQNEFFLSNREGIHIGGQADHTLHQAEWLFSKVRECNISSLALVVSQYHLLRVYLTFLKKFLKEGINPPMMIPVPAPASPETITPETGVNAWMMSRGEIQRILRYQKQHHVATLEELREYLAVLWDSSLLASQRMDTI